MRYPRIINYACDGTEVSTHIVFGRANDAGSGVEWNCGGLIVILIRSSCRKYIPPQFTPGPRWCEIDWQDIIHFCTAATKFIMSLCKLTSSLIKFNSG